MFNNYRTIWNKSIYLLEIFEDEFVVWSNLSKRCQKGPKKGSKPSKGGSLSIGRIGRECTFLGHFSSGHMGFLGVFMSGHFGPKGGCTRKHAFFAFLTFFDVFLIFYEIFEFILCNNWSFIWFTSFVSIINYFVG